MPLNEVSIAMQYYSFTTMSTVGLGDFNPKSDAERLACSLVMLCGVSITTLLIYSLESSSKEIKEYIEKNNDLRQLGLFFSTLKKFNNDSPLPESKV